MPRYFFQVIDGEIVPDLQGLELPDMAAARRVAVDIAAERLKGSGEEFWRERNWRLEVVDGSGTLLFVLAIAAESAPPPDAPARLGDRG